MKKMAGFTAAFALIGYLLLSLISDDLKIQCSRTYNAVKSYCIRKMNECRTLQDRNVVLTQPVVEQGRLMLPASSASGRTMDSLDLSDKAKQLFEDIKAFRTVETTKEYKRIGTPKRYGALLYGPPGNGKTQFAIALATELNVPLMPLTLSSIFLGDEALRKRIFSNIPEGSVVLFEDVDEAFKTQAVNRGKISVDMLLSGIDGPGVPEDVIFLMTCNDISKLPTKLLRRFPKQVLFDRPDVTRAEGIFRRYYPEADLNTVNSFVSTFNIINRIDDDPAKPFISCSDLEGLWKSSLQYVSSQRAEKLGYIYSF